MTTVTLQLRGRCEFTRVEAEEIKASLRKLGARNPRDVAELNSQKRIRAKLRKKHCFYISDFRDRLAGFTADDFCWMVKLARIIITETPDRHCPACS